MKEVDTPTTSVASPVPTAPANNELPSIGDSPIFDRTAQESYTLLQKGLILAVVLGCVALYVRMSNKKRSKGRYMEKSMA